MAALEPERSDAFTRSACLHRPQHAAEVATVYLAQVVIGLAAAQESVCEAGDIVVGGHLGELQRDHSGRWSPGGDIAEEIHGHDLGEEIEAQAEVIDADQVGDMVEVVDPAGE